MQQRLSSNTSSCNNSPAISPVPKSDKVGTYPRLLLETLAQFCKYLACMTLLRKSSQKETNFWLLQRKKTEEAAILCWKRDSYRVLQGPRGKFGLLGSPLHSPASSQLLGVHPIKTARDLSDCKRNGNRIVVTGNLKPQQHDLHLLRLGSGLVGYPTLATPETNQDTWNSGTNGPAFLISGPASSVPPICPRSGLGLEVTVFKGHRQVNPQESYRCMPATQILSSLQVLLRKGEGGSDTGGLRARSHLRSRLCGLSSDISQCAATHLSREGPPQCASAWFLAFFFQCLILPNDGCWPLGSQYLFARS